MKGYVREDDHGRGSYEEPFTEQQRGHGPDGSTGLRHGCHDEWDSPPHNLPGGEHLVSQVRELQGLLRPGVMQPPLIADFAEISDVALEMGVPVQRIEIMAGFKTAQG